jgi:hypothetical protein
MDSIRRTGGKVMRLEDLIVQNATNHYKMLVIVDNNREEGRVIKQLEWKGWISYDIEKAILSILDTIPEDKHKLRIGSKIKQWFQTLPERIILYNTSILYSPELGRLNPIGAFKYKSRDKEIIVFVEGKLYGNRLQYSEYGRPDFTEMDVSEFITVRMEDIDG